MSDTSQGISVGDAVLTFLGDTTNLDAAFDSTEARAPVWAGNVNAAVGTTADMFTKASASATTFGEVGEAAGTSLADAFKLLPPVVEQTDSDLQNMAFALNNVGVAGVEAATEVEGSMREARGTIALLGEEIGVHVPRHLQTFVAGLPGMQTALSLAFAPVAILALIDVGSKLIDKVTEIANHAQEVSDAWQKVDDDSTTAFTHTGDQILQVEAQIDELNKDKLGALKDQLELIDHATLGDLSKQLEQIQQDTDAAFSKMQTWWDWITTMGQGNAGIAAAKSDFDDINKQVQQLLKFGTESADPFAALTTSLTNAKQKLADLEAQQKTAGAEQKAIIQQQIDDLQNHYVPAMEKVTAGINDAKAALAQLSLQQQEAEKELQQAGDDESGALAANVAAIAKQVEARQDDLNVLEKEGAQIAQNLKLDQQREQLETQKSAKSKRVNEAEKEAEALLAAQKTLGDAMFALIEQQSLQQVEATEQGYSLENAATKDAYVQQLDLITQAELQKSAIQAKAANDEYELQLNLAKQELANLQKRGSSTMAEQIKVNAQIEALEEQHQAKLLSTWNTAMEALRKTMSQPIPFITAVPAGVDQIENDITRGFDQASAAAKALGITLTSELDTALESAYDNYAKLIDLQKQGIVTQHDVDLAYVQLVRAQLNYAQETGATGDAVRKLKEELTQLLQAQLAEAKASGESVEALQKIQKEIQELDGKQQKAAISTKNFTSQLKKDMEDGASAYQLFGDMAGIVTEGIVTSIGSAFSALVSGQESFGQAMEKATAKMISSLASQWAQYFAAKGIADIFTDPPLGAAELAAAAALEAISGVLSGLASGTKGSSDSAISKVTTESKATTTATTAGAQPVQVVNTQHLATGGVASTPTLVMIGDSEHGGAAQEAVLPLENARALDAIAAALIPALLKAMNYGGSQYSQVPSAPTVPSFADGGLVTSPLLAMVGDDGAGGAADEGILPLENSTAMSRIASVIASHLAAVPSPAVPRFEVGASTALLSAATLSAAAHISPAPISGGESFSPDRFAEIVEKQTSQLAHQLSMTASGAASKIQIELQSDIPQLVKKINHATKTGRARLTATSLRPGAPAPRS